MLCDIIVLYCMKKRFYYREKKYKFVEDYEQVCTSRTPSRQQVTSCRLGRVPVNSYHSHPTPASPDPSQVTGLPWHSLHPPCGREGGVPGWLTPPQQPLGDCQSEEPSRCPSSNVPCLVWRERVLSAPPLL